MASGQQEVLFMMVIRLVNPLELGRGQPGPRECDWTVEQEQDSEGQSSEHVAELYFVDNVF